VLEPVDNMRVLITHIGFVKTDVASPKASIVQLANVISWALESNETQMGAKIIPASPDATK
jgi:hypothetical protein